MTARPRPTGYAVVFTWPSGRREVRYTRPRSDPRLAREVLALRRRARAGGWACPYAVEGVEYAF